MKFFGIIFLLALLVSCASENNYEEMDQYFNTEIKNRIVAIEKLRTPGDSLVINITVIDKEINNIILLSKDIENIQASVSKANTFFFSAGKYI